MIATAVAFAALDTLWVTGLAFTCSDQNVENPDPRFCDAIFETGGMYLLVALPSACVIVSGVLARRQRHPPLFAAGITAAIVVHVVVVLLPK